MSALHDLSRVPTEAECLDAIENNLSNYYTIAQRGDILISREMKVRAFEAFQKAKKSPLSYLSGMSDTWFINTQLQGWNTIVPKYIKPYGLDSEQLKRII